MMYNIETEILKIPGLKREYTFLHISDAHIVYSYPEDSEQAKSLAQKHTKKWTTTDVSPLEAFKNVLLLADNSNTDGLFIAGDCVDYIDESTVRCLNGLLENVCTPVHYVYGNHEGGSYVENIPEPRVYYPMYSKLMQGNPAVWTADYGEFVIVGMDDSDKKISDEQIQALKMQIARNVPIILLMHIPIFTDEICEPVKKVWGEDGIHHFTLGTERHNQDVKELCELVKSPDSNIAAIFAGHIHFAHKGEFAPGRMQYVSAPAFTKYVRKIILKPQ